MRILSIVCMAMGPIGAFSYSSSVKTKKRIDQEGIETIALAVGKIESRRRGSSVYDVDIEFRVEGEGTREERINVARDLYERIDSQPQIKIKYLEEDPSKVIIVGEAIEFAEVYPIMWGFFLLGAAGTWWSFVHKRRDRESPEGSAQA